MIICVNCGKATKIENAEGSHKHPFCKKCFKKVWKNDYDKYTKWLAKTHIC